jgi:ADP-ribosylglycohydrolase
MLGAIAGDIIGSVYEFDSLKPAYDFPLFTEESIFTDDSVLTVALADSILSNTEYKVNLVEY